MPMLTKIACHFLQFRFNFKRAHSLSYRCRMRDSIEDFAQHWRRVEIFAEIERVVSLNAHCRLIIDVVNNHERVAIVRQAHNFDCILK